MWNYFGDPDATVSATTSAYYDWHGGMSNWMGRMMGGNYGVGFWFWGFFMWVLWILAIVALIALIRYLWKKGN